MVSSPAPTGTPDVALARRELSGVLADLLLPPAWVADALCTQVDPELFFPTRGRQGRATRRVCAGCPVRVECAEYAIGRSELDGVWGGLSPKQRKAARRARRRAPAPDGTTTTGTETAA